MFKFSFRLFDCAFAIIALLVAGVSLDRSALGQSDPLLTEFDRASQLRDVGKFSEAIPHAENARRLAETRYGTNHLTYAVALGMLADLHYLQNNIGQSEGEFKLAIAAFDRVRTQQNAKTLILSS
jgi:hypothetical protein